MGLGAKRKVRATAFEITSGDCSLKSVTWVMAFRACRGQMLGGKSDALRLSEMPCRRFFVEIFWKFWHYTMIPKAHRCEDTVFQGCSRGHRG
eukprot:IDg19007t1